MNRPRLTRALAAAILAMAAAGCTVARSAPDAATPRATNADPTTPTTAPARTAAPRGLHPSTAEKRLGAYCLGRGGRLQLLIYFDPHTVDTDMLQAARQLHGDTRIDQLTTETQQQAYARFLVIFKDQPELIAEARPEAIPASIAALPAAGITTTDLAADLADEITTIDSLNTQDCLLPQHPPR